MWLIYLFFQMLVCLLLQVTDLFALTEKYNLIDLGLLDYEGSEVSSINNQGQICGYYLNGKSYVFVWESKNKCNYTQVNISMNPKINNLGDIYGSRWINRGLWNLDQETVYKWENPFSYLTYFHFHDIGYPSNLFSTAYFWDVNDLGQILVLNHNVIYTKWNHEIWLYDNKQWQRITDSHFHVAHKINNQSQLLGYFFEDTFSVNKKSKICRTAVHDLKTGTTHIFPFAEESRGHDINDSGQVVGLFYNLHTESFQGYFGYPTGEVIVLGDLYPVAVNNNAQIIGRYFSGEKENKPFIWDNGILLDLADVTSLVDNNGHQWKSLDALIDINDRGEIIGQGVFNNKTHGFLLVPIQ